MIIYLGADHRGYALKEYLKAQLTNHSEYEVVDLGSLHAAPEDDYSDYAAAVARKVAADPMGSRGIVMCGSGFGVDIVANKFAGVRSALATSPEQIAAGRHDDDVNVLALPADFLGHQGAMEIVAMFLSTPFDSQDARYSRRLKKLKDIESAF